VGGSSIIFAALLALAAPAARGVAPLPPREPAVAPAEGEPPALPLPPPPIPEGASAERLAPPVVPESWMDASHGAVARGVFDVMDWFDRFFSDVRRLEVGRSESFLSLQGTLRYSSTGQVTPGGAVRVSATMPRLGSLLGRARLVISGETPGIQTPTPTDPGSAPRAPGQTSPQTSAELRYDLVRAQRVVLELATGVLFPWPPEVFGRLRLRWMEPLWEGALARLTPAGFWVSDANRFGTTVQVDLEQQVAEADRLRISNAFGITESSSGWEGGTELAYYHAFTPASALSFSGSWIGATKPFPYVKLFRVSVRLRHAFWRKWFFVELEPEALWPKDPLLPGRREQGSLFVRFEVTFDAASIPL